MASSANKIAGAPADLLALPDDTLEEILLRLDAADELACASAACTTFRRLVSAPRFLRRFRSLHAPPVLGFLEHERPGEFHPAKPPHRSARAARALTQAADFTFSFLGVGAPRCWQVCDARDGRVLLYRGPEVLDRTPVFASLVVCDPLHRRHVQLPRIPGDLLVDTGGTGLQDFEPFLDPVRKEEKEEEDFSSFRVICVVHCLQKLVAFRYSSDTRNWQAFTFNRSRPLTHAMVAFPGLFERHYAHGSFYWTYSDSDVNCLFVLNTHEMQFSDFDHPPSSQTFGQAIVEAGGGRLGLLTLGDSVLDFYCKNLHNNGLGSEEWQHYQMIPLPERDCYWEIYTAAEGYVLLGAIPQGLLEPEYFTLDLKTLLIEKLCSSDGDIDGAHLYARFTGPLALATSTISDMVCSLDASAGTSQGDTIEHSRVD